MRIKELFEAPLFESVGIEVFHGDNHNTARLEPRLMNNGNNQEGIGIYFSDQQSTAHSYGRHIVKAMINPRNFVNARHPIGRHVQRQDGVRILKDLMGSDEEAMFYLATDYGVYLTDPEELNDHHLAELFGLLNNEEVRNFQITLANAFDVVTFVRSWNRHTKIDGTFNSNNRNETWYAIINDKIGLERVE